MREAVNINDVLVNHNRLVRVMANAADRSELMQAYNDALQSMWQVFNARNKELLDVKNDT